MLLTYNRLVELVNAGVIEGVPLENINGASIDLTLGPIIHREHCAHPFPIVDLALKENIQTRPIDITKLGYYDVYPGQFILASTQEIFHLPSNIAGEFKLKSSAARNGLNHHLAGWCDPYWNGSVLTLEFKNNVEGHILRLRPGMKVGQFIAFEGEPVPEHAAYSIRGQYNGDRETTPSKGIK